ncbi:hypothetical protein FEZ34_01680 [Lacticaseibacillus casei]|uniref:hypothetical protein n=1 Tax=Lacticaseibacillus casei TaxID=1582 RepID=UPI001109EA02|nr:hypothetical protein [Lacticaseibacillus casei]TLQ51917.1 hypothetical protein FEZ34_01680 [Lacticaseibacillus casei]
METNGRDNLQESDKAWERHFSELMERYVKPGTLLFRVHAGGKNRPSVKDFADRSNSTEVFDKAYKCWLRENDEKQISFNNHWVSFTSDVDVVGSSYFESKGLRRFVIVIKARKTLNISQNFEQGFDEKKVVAPMEKLTLVEILPFKDFMNKYGTAKSDYERREYQR